MFNPHVMLVTGGSGFIGSHFIKLVLKQLPAVKVINLDALTYAGCNQSLSDLENDERYHFVKGDICDRQLLANLLREYHVDTIVHFAAESHVDRSISGPAQFIQTNLVGTFALLEEARSFWLEEKAWNDTQCRFHHISTDEVYGSLQADDPAFAETNQYQPNSPYSASKAGSDHLVRAYQHTYGLPTTLSNCSNNYGPYQHDEKLIPTIIHHCVKQQPIPIYGDGQNIRDWLHVEDHCDAILTILQQAPTGEMYNIGSDNEWTNLDLTKLICQIIDERFTQEKSSETLIEFVTDRLGHDQRYAINSQKIQQQLNWKASYDFQKGLQQTVDFYLEQYHHH